jgi:phosphate acetyltransferase
MIDRYEKEQNPESEKLAGIAISSAESFKYLVEGEPLVAMLSYSTKGSAEGEDAQKMRAAKSILDTQNVDFVYDGEMQLDAAIVPEVGASKAPGSPVAGKANVLVFPSLEAGNIGYKLVQRFAGATAIGPILQGLAAPINDLSRGCSAEDIYLTVAVAAVQSIQLKSKQ